MKMLIRLVLGVSILLIFNHLYAQGTAYNYEGQLSENGNPANGSYDLTFALFNVSSNGSAVTGPITKNDVTISNGRFSVTLDFGAGVFNGTSYWLELAVRTNGGGNFTNLAPRQAILPEPYAIYATSAGTAGSANSIASGNIVGTIPLAQLPGAVITNNASGIALAGSFLGDGNGLTNLNISQLAVAIVTNSEPTVTFGSLILSSNLYLPAATTNAGMVYSGTNILVHFFGLRNIFIGNRAGNLSMAGSANVGIGDGALSRNVNGSENTAIGSQTLLLNSNGTFNTALGFMALSANTNGNYNTASGAQALQFNTTGNYNTANGDAALVLNTIGSENTAGGVAALESNKSGNDNTASGFYALSNNTNGSNNSAYGAYALYGCTNGNNNIALGYQAGYNISTGNSNIDIGNMGLANDTNIIRIGSAQAQTFIAGMITGNGAGLTNLNLVGPAVNSVLGNTAYGYQALISDIIGGVQNTAIGFHALANNTTGADNTATGWLALDSNTTGGANTADGEIALASNTTGSDNSATGGSALTHNTTGNKNTADGFVSLASNSTGNDNTAIGYAALNSNTNGSGNTATGEAALYSNTNGSYNTAIGYQALPSNTAGSKNIAAGYQAGFYITTGSSNIDIGNMGMVTDTNIIRIGSGQTQAFIAGIITGDGGGLTNLNVIASQLISVGNTNGGNNNFFIGSAGNSANSGSFNTGNGSSALHLNSSGSYNTANGFGALYFNLTGSYNTADGYTALLANESGSFNTANGHQALAFNSTGSNNIALGYQAGYNVLTGSYNIEIGSIGTASDNNTILIGTQGIQTNTAIAGIFGATVATGVPVYVNSSGQLGTLTSSARFKDDIHDMEDASEVLLSLRPVSFRYKPAIDSKGIPQFGLVAEEVEKVDADLVARDEKNQIYTVRYDAVNAMLLNEFLKQHRKVEEQHRKVEAQTAEIQDLKSRLEKLEQLVAARTGDEK